MYAEGITSFEDYFKETNKYSTRSNDLNDEKASPDDYGFDCVECGETIIDGDPDERTCDQCRSSQDPYEDFE
jgi:hypothetical protein